MYLSKDFIHIKLKRADTRSAPTTTTTTIFNTQIL